MNTTLISRKNVSVTKHFVNFSIFTRFNARPYWKIPERNVECSRETSSDVRKPNWIKYRPEQHGTFFQRKPTLRNPFQEDIPLINYLKTRVPREVNNEICKDLDQFGHRIVNEIDDCGWECETNPPQLKNQNAWGERVDELTTCNAWKHQHEISAEEGLISIAYERKLDIWSRIHQVCKLYLYAPSSGLYTCPLAMTDGAARTIEVSSKKDEMFLNAFKNLTSRIPKNFWTSGQWMTEKKGGSDVANSTETIAVPDNGFYRLFGYKWFTSATDSNMALTLASIVENDDPSKVQKGLTMFYVETKLKNGEYNNIQLIRLKNKLGTRQLPTAELLLDGCIAYKMSDDERGISTISIMLNITRLHNSIAAVAVMRRILLLARDYSHKRIAFGKSLIEHPLHVRVLNKMETETRGCFLLLLKVTSLIGKSELNTASKDELLLLRLLMPVMKLYTAKQAVAVASEGLEAFGGQGYMEDSRLPQLLRDAQVLPIWEGTTNIMSLDVLRCLSKNFEVLLSLEKYISLCLDAGKKNAHLNKSCLEIESSIKYALDFAKQFPDMLHIASRDISFTIARTYIGALLIENASLSGTDTDIFTANQWCEMQELCPLLNKTYSSYSKNDKAVVMEGYVGI